MKRIASSSCLCLALLALGVADPRAAWGQAPEAGGEIRTGSAAFGDWTGDKPGLRRRIAPADLPRPLATRSAGNGPTEVKSPADARPQAPAGFKVDLFASGLAEPRLLRVAPSGDVFVAESSSGRIRVLRTPDGATKAERTETFAANLAQPFGIAFHPPGPEPQWVYVANTNTVVRFPYRNGDLKARGPAETIVKSLSPETGGHWTRDIAFSPDGARMFVSVGSLSNVGESLARRDAAWIARWEASHGLGAAWDDEERRADVLVFSPEGRDGRVFATGIRNCVGLAVEPQTGEPWCSTNERDGLGDDLAPDYVTRVREGAFYGWPWYYIGPNEDPRHKGARPDLKDKVTVPDVLIQPHSAPLQMTFYDGQMFPPEHRGSAFVALHGSWNRAKRTGYKVVRVPLRDGVPSGEYEDFLTGFVLNDRSVWGRPVGVAVARDGALLVSEDANGTIWRVSYAGRP